MTNGGDVLLAICNTIEAVSRTQNTWNRSWRNWKKLSVPIRKWAVTDSHIIQICMPRGANVLILAQLPAPVESIRDTSSLSLSFRSFMTWLTWCQPRWCCLVHGVFSLCIQGFQTNSWVQVYSFHCFQWQFSATDPAETPMLSICSNHTKTVHTVASGSVHLCTLSLVAVKSWFKELAILQRKLS